MIVVGRGRLMADMPMSELIAQASSSTVLVRSPQAAALADALTAADITIFRTDHDSLDITGLTAAEIGDRRRGGVPRHDPDPPHPQESAMSTVTAPATHADAAVCAVVEVKPVTPMRVLRSEWVKMRSLRSTTLTLVAAVVTMVGVGWIIGGVSNASWSTLRPEELLMFSAVDLTLVGFNLAQLAVGVLGVLLVTGEYATGMIQATFGAVPGRLPVLGAKAALHAGVTFALMLDAAFAAFLGGQLFLGAHGTDLLAPGALRGIVGVAGYLTLIAVFAVALGFILRSTAGGVATLFGLLMVLPGLGLLLPSSRQLHLLPCLPSNAGACMITTHTAEGSLPASGGLLVLLAWSPQPSPKQPCSSRNATPDTQTHVILLPCRPQSPETGTPARSRR